MRGISVVISSNQQYERRGAEDCNFFFNYYTKVDTYRLFISMLHVYPETEECDATPPRIPGNRADSGDGLLRRGVARKILRACLTK